MSRKPLAALAVLLVAVAPSAASAAPKTLVLYYAESGEQMMPSEVAEGPGTQIAYRFGGFVCEGSTIGTSSMSDSTDDAKTDELDIGSADFAARCDDNNRHAALYPEITGFPWTLGLGANGKASVTGGIDVTIHVEQFGGPKECSFEGGKLSGTVALGGEVRVSLTGKLKHVAHAKEPCNVPLEVTQLEFPVTGLAGLALDDRVE